MSAQTLVNHPNHQSLDTCLESLILEVDALISSYLASVDELSKGQRNIAEQAARYHLDTPGQKVRARLCLLACQKLNVNHHDMLILSAVAELMHNASLIHDDIQDRDDIRRGRETVWKKFGTDIAICAGDLLISAAYGMLANLSDSKALPSLISKLSSRTASVINGQCHDIEYKQYPSNSLDVYLDIAKAKSGALLSLPIELALIASGNKQFLDVAVQATQAFAVGYQMVYDLNDIAKDATNHAGAKSPNIVFVLADAGIKSSVNESTALANQYLSEAIRLAKQLPYEIGELLVDYAVRLQGQIVHVIEQ